MNKVYEGFKESEEFGHLPYDRLVEIIDAETYRRRTRWWEAPLTFIVLLAVGLVVSSLVAKLLNFLPL